MPHTAAAPLFRRGESGYWRVCAALFAGGLATFALLYFPQPMLPLLSTDFGLSPATASLSVSATTVALVLSAYPLALLTRRRGRLLLAMNLGAYSGALLCIAEAAAPSFVVLVALRTVQGLAISGFVVLATAYLTSRVHPAGLGLAGGLYIAGTSVGGMLGRLLVGTVSSAAGWRPALVVLAVVTVICALAFTMLIPPPPHRNTAPSPAAPDRRDTTTPGTRTRSVLEPLLIRLYAVGFLLSSVFVAGANYLGYRLHDAPFHLSDAAIGLIFIVYLAGAAGSAMAGRLADHRGFRTALLAAAVVILVAIAVLIPANLVAIIIGFGLLTTGFFAAHSTANAWVGARASDKVAATTSYIGAYYAGSTIGGWLGGLPYDHGRWSALTIYLTGLTIIILAIAVTTPAGFDHPNTKSETNWERLRRERRRIRGAGEGWIPAVEVVGELVVEDSSTDLQQ